MFDSEYLLETIARNRKKRPESSDFISKLRIDISKANLGSNTENDDKYSQDHKTLTKVASPKTKRPINLSGPDTPYANTHAKHKTDALRRSSHSIKFTNAIKERLSAFSSARSLKALNNKPARLSNSSSAASGQYPDNMPLVVQPFIDLPPKVYSFKDSSLGSQSISKKGSNQSVGGQSHKSINSGSFDQSRELEKKLNLSSQANKTEFELFKQSLRFESMTLDLFTEIRNSSQAIGVDCIDEEVQYYDKDEVKNDVKIQNDDKINDACAKLSVPVGRHSMGYFDLSLIEEASHLYEQTPNNGLSPINPSKTALYSNDNFTHLAEKNDHLVKKTYNTIKSLEGKSSKKELKTFVYKMHNSETSSSPEALPPSPDIRRPDNQIDYEDGSRYTGDIQLGKRHGFGVLIMADNSKMEGDWKNNIIHGEGRLYYLSGRLAYEGCFKHGQLNGHGVMYAEDYNHKPGGPKVLSEPPRVSHNSCTDYTVLDYQNLNKTFEHWTNFEGCFQDDMKTGIGVMEMKNGDIFMGEFDNDMANGPGSYQTVRGVKFLGIWRDNFLVYELMLPSGMQTDKTKLTF